MQRAVLVMVTLGLSVIAIRPGAAQLPDVVSYQGYLEQGGEPVNDPAARLIFKIYTNAEGGTALWSEQHLNVPVVDGVFSVLLGSVNAAGFQGLPFGEPLWLGVNPGGGELSPRTPLVSVPFSMYSRRAESTTGISIIEPTTGADAPGVIAGHESNSIGPGVDGATISGGGYDGGATDIWPNRVEADYGTIGGGRNNSVTEFAGTVGGGTANVASGDRATVAGGRENTASDLYATVCGGSINLASDYYSTVAGGYQNTASFGGAIAGGLYNTASATSAVGGGHSNVASGEKSTVSGGMDNSATALQSTVGGGWENTASGDRATVAGGNNNTASRYTSAVGGGLGNLAGGFASTVPGGRYNVASGDYSMASGYRAKARHYGTYVWNDASDALDSVYTTAHFQYLIRATGGVGIGTNAPAADVHISGDSNTDRPHLILQETGPSDYARLQLQNSDAAAEFWHIAAGGPNTDRLNFWTRGNNVVTFWPHGIDFGGGNLITTSVGAELTQGGVWQNNSGRESKTGFEAVDGDEVLERLAGLPITRWRYKVEPESVLHVGPVAEDFYGAFGLGTDATTIGTVDADGIALAAIQSLHELVQEQQAEIEAQARAIADLKADVASLRAMIAP